MKIQSLPEEFEAWFGMVLIEAAATGKWSDVPQPVRAAVDAGIIAFERDGITVVGSATRNTGRYRVGLEDFLVMDQDGAFFMVTAADFGKKYRTGV